MVYINATEVPQIEMESLPSLRDILRKQQARLPAGRKVSWNLTKRRSSNLSQVVEYSSEDRTMIFLEDV